MKKWIIGAWVGGTIAFAWQTASHTVLDLHYKAEGYTVKQDTILTFLKSIRLEEGNYILPRLPKGTPQGQMEAFSQQQSGRPWATLTFRNSWDASMGGKILRGYLASILMAVTLMWILGRIPDATLSTCILTGIGIGLIGFLTFPYAGYTWYQVGAVWEDLIDAIMMWGLCGLWLGWWLKKK